MRPTGAINLGNWIAVTVVVSILWAGAIFLPLWWDNMSVKESVEIASAMGYATHADQIQLKIMYSVNQGPTMVGYHFTEDDNGQLVELPGLGLDEDNIHIEQNELSHTLRITVDYVRKVRLWPTQKYRDVHFHIDKIRND